MACNHNTQGIRQVKRTRIQRWRNRGYTLRTEFDTLQGKIGKICPRRHIYNDAMSDRVNYALPHLAGNLKIAHYILIGNQLPVIILKTR
ncbi:hypothetical protein IMSAGC016_01727 [Muribaculaceae bacterium]|nr:hypothetical protein IMSAGC016_01727 [Muribaculaceae bacterium]